jgi:aspartate aminotransferase
MNVSKRVSLVPSSPIRKLVPLADAAKKLGKKVYHLNIGQPDILTPSVFFDAISQHREPVLKYTHSQGDPNLIRAIQQYFLQDGIHFDFEDIIVTTGGSEALIFALTTVADPYDEILIPEPFYANTGSFMNQTSIVPIPVPTKAETAFHLPTKDEFESKITPKTKAILLTNPNNPSGAVLTKQELDMVTALCIKHQLFLIVDEVYRKFAFDGNESISIGHIEEAKEVAIIIDSVSKRYSSCGARIGSVQSRNKLVMSSILKLAQARLSVSTVDQIGAAKLYEMGDAYIEDVRQEYLRRRDIIVKHLLQIPGVRYEIPEGSFYMILGLPVLDAEDFTKWLLTDFDLNNETVMLAPAKDFYRTPGAGLNQVRLAYMLNCNELEKAMEILKQGLQVYQSLKK